MQSSYPFLASAEPPALSKRLAAVAAPVLRGEPMADIGADHGLLPVSLLLSGAVPRALALDRAPAPLARARALAAACGISAEQGFEARLSEGLAALAPGEVRTVVMAGTGARTQLEVLRQRPDRLEGVARIVLQPNRDAAALRAWAGGAGWLLRDEALVEERGRFYPVLVLDRLAPGQAPEALSEADQTFGPRLREAGGPSFAAWLAAEADWLARMVASPALNAAARAHFRRAAEAVEQERRRLNPLDAPG